VSSGRTKPGDGETALAGTGATARPDDARRPPPARGALATWWAARHPLVRHAVILVSYIALGIVVTWPRVTYLAGRLPNARDSAEYSWDMWWMARQLLHLGNPFTTHYMIAPVGTPLAYHALMPLVGLLMTPVTMAAGPAFSANLLVTAMPGILCYAMYRAARLWLPGPGAYAAGLFFGLSSTMTWRSWYELNIAAGTVFLPLTLEAAVKLRRNPAWWRAVVLGVVLGLCLLVDSESTILALIVLAAAMATWIVRQPAARKIGLLALAAAAGLLVASPQILAMLQQTSALTVSPNELAYDYVTYGVALPQMFAPSPRLASFGLTGLSSIFYHGIKTEGVPTFGVALTVLALAGAVIGWRRTWLWLAGWLAVCVVTLGPVIYLGSRAYVPLPLNDHGYKLSALMPYTWIVRLPGMSGFRESNRFIALGLMPAALLAGVAVQWIWARSKPALLLVACLAALEFGWSAAGAPGTMPTTLPAVDGPIAADHSGSVVVDVPLAIRGGTTQVGAAFPGEALVLATLDDHPRAIGHVARVPPATVAAWQAHPFYADLLQLEQGGGGPASAAGIGTAAADARRVNAGWVLVWERVTPALGHFLTQTGFRFDYQADGVSVYRPASH
jgi:hypothetical protein